MCASELLELLDRRFDQRIIVHPLPAVFQF